MKLIEGFVVASLVVFSIHSDTGQLLQQVAGGTWTKPPIGNKLVDDTQGKSPVLIAGGTRTKPPHTSQYLITKWLSLS